MFARKVAQVKTVTLCR